MDVPLNLSKSCRTSLYQVMIAYALRHYIVPSRLEIGGHALCSSRITTVLMFLDATLCVIRTCWHVISRNSTLKSNVGLRKSYTMKCANMLCVCTCQLFFLWFYMFSTMFIVCCCVIFVIVVFQHRECICQFKLEHPPISFSHHGFRFFPRVALVSKALHCLRA